MSSDPENEIALQFECPPPNFRGMNIFNILFFRREDMRMSYQINLNDANNHFQNIPIIGSLIRIGIYLKNGT